MRRLFPLLVLVPMVATAQITPKPHAVVNLQTRVGSFKVLGANEQPAEGTFEFSFSGSVLVSGLQGQVVTSGNVRLENEDKKHEKKVYFGKGRIRVTGRFRAIQWFGRDMKGKFDGWGVIRLYGEFDSALETGTYQFTGGEIQDWGTGGRQISIPPPVETSEAAPRPRIRRVGG